MLWLLCSCSRKRAVDNAFTLLHPVQRCRVNGSDAGFQRSPDSIPHIATSRQICAKPNPVKHCDMQQQCQQVFDQNKKVVDIAAPCTFTMAPSSPMHLDTIVEGHVAAHLARFARNL